MQHQLRSRPRFAEEWLVAVLDSLREGVVALGGDGRIVAANPAAEQLLEFRIREQRGRDWRELAWATLVDREGQPVLEAAHPVVVVLRDHRPSPPRVVGLTGTDGRMRWLEMAAHVPGEDGRDPLGGAVVSFVDATARVEAETERQRLIGVLREVMWNTSHDLRSPLATILGMGRLLDEAWDELPDDERRHAVEVVTRQAEKLDRLVDDLSVMSRLEGGVIVPETCTVPVVRIIEATLDEVVDTSAIEVTVDPRLTVVVDPDHGRRMLVNLVENALKYGDPPIVLEAVPVGPRVRVTVTDRGPGVPDELAPRLFERFSRGSDRPVRGMGLGLAIVERLGQLNGASIAHDPSWTEGARFVLDFPR
jgi:PAS domain S-box-containing protein